MFNKLYREDGPAIALADGHKEWWLDGERHRVDGPAVERADGGKEWWRNGVKQDAPLRSINDPWEPSHV